MKLLSLAQDYSNFNTQQYRQGLFIILNSFIIIVS